MSDVTTSNTTLTGDEAKQFVATMAQLDAVLSTSPLLLSKGLDAPAPGSPVQIANAKALRDPYEQCRLLVLASEDHLRTSLMLLQNNLLPMFSLYSLLRPAAEADARMAYILDPGIGERDRLGRGLGVRHESLREQSKVKPEPARFAAASKRIEDKAISNALSPVYSNPKKGKPEIIGFGAALKNETELLRLYHRGGELIYRVLSSHVHSRPWAWLDPSTAIPTSEPGISQIRVELNTKLYMDMLTLVIRTHEDNLIRLLGLAGHSRTEWDTAKTEEMNRVRPRYLALLTVSPNTGPT